MFERFFIRREYSARTMPRRDFQNGVLRERFVIGIVSINIWLYGIIAEENQQTWPSRSLLDRERAGLRKDVANIRIKNTRVLSRHSIMYVMVSPRGQLIIFTWTPHKGTCCCYRTNAGGRLSRKALSLCYFKLLNIELQRMRSLMTCNQHWKIRDEWLHLNQKLPRYLIPFLPNWDNCWWLAGVPSMRKSSSIKRREWACSQNLWARTAQSQNRNGRATARMFISLMLPVWSLIVQAFTKDIQQIARSTKSWQSPWSTPLSSARACAYGMSVSEYAGQSVSFQPFWGNFSYFSSQGLSRCLEKLEEVAWVNA